MTQHKTRRGELMAKLEGKKIGAGHYTVQGFDIKMVREASGSRPGLWTVADADGDHSFEAPHLTVVLEQINEWTVTPTEVIDETPEPVAPEVLAEPVVAEVQDVVVEIVPAPRTRTRKPKSRRAQLLAELKAREISTAEYEVSGHHVEYVAPGVMPRNAGGRWRTTLLDDEGVVVSWNLSLTAALEVIASRVNEVSAEDSRRADEAAKRSTGARRYVAVYTSDRTSADLCELHAPGCADLRRAGKSTDPRVDVVFDITDEEAAMQELDVDDLGYDMHSVKVMPCAQHAPLAENAHA